MAGNNSIQILRGSNVKTNSTISQQTLLDGQPLYDKATGYLYIGDGDTIANTNAVNANVATQVSNNLRLNIGGTTYTYNGRSAVNVNINTTNVQEIYEDSSGYLHIVLY